MGPLLNFEDGLNPSTDSDFSARFFSISPRDFTVSCLCHLTKNVIRKRFFVQAIGDAFMFWEGEPLSEGYITLERSFGGWSPAGIL